MSRLPRADLRAAAGGRIASSGLRHLLSSLESTAGWALEDGPHAHLDAPAPPHPRHQLRR